MPPSARCPTTGGDDAEYFVLSTHRAFGGYIRGQILQAAIYGSGTAAIMLGGRPQLCTALATVFAVVLHVDTIHRTDPGPSPPRGDLPCSFTWIGPGGCFCSCWGCSRWC